MCLSHLSQCNEQEGYKVKHLHWEALCSNIYKTEAKGIGRLNFVNNVRIRFAKYNFKGEGAV